MSSDVSSKSRLLPLVPKVVHEYLRQLLPDLPDGSYATSTWACELMDGRTNAVFRCSGRVSGSSTPVDVVVKFLSDAVGERARNTERTAMEILWSEKPQAQRPLVLAIPCGDEEEKAMTKGYTGVMVLPFVQGDVDGSTPIPTTDIIPLLEHIHTSSANDPRLQHMSEVKLSVYVAGKTTNEELLRMSKELVLERIRIAQREFHTPNSDAFETCVGLLNLFDDIGCIRDVVRHETIRIFFIPTLCHCDVHSGNVVRGKGTVEALIDWEYTHVMFPLAELAGVFVEMMGIEVDGSLFPTKKQRTDTYKQYAAIRGTDLTSQEVSFLDDCVFVLARLEGYYWACWANHMIESGSSTSTSIDRKAKEQLVVYKEKRLQLFSDSSSLIDMSL